MYVRKIEYNDIDIKNYHYCKINYSPRGVNKSKKSAIR